MFPAAFSAWFTVGPYLPYSALKLGSMSEEMWKLQCVAFNVEHPFTADSLLEERRWLG